MRAAALRGCPIMPVVASGSRTARKGENAGLWRGIGRLGTALLVFAVFYTLYLIFHAPGSFFDWINTLLSTVLSVFAALVIRFLLFTYQSRETDKKRKAELGEAKSVIEESKTVVQDDALEKGGPSHKVKVSLHYAHPLVVEEAVRSGLFNEGQTAEMLALARSMRAHNVRVQEFLSVFRQIEGRSGEMRQSLLGGSQALYTNTCPSVAPFRGPRSESSRDARPY